MHKIENFLVNQIFGVFNEHQPNLFDFLYINKVNHKP